MPKPLDERIAAAMGADARLATVAELITEVEGVTAATKVEHDRLDALSKSATASETEADAAADVAAKLSRKVIRLAAKRDQLEARHIDLANSERQQRQRAEYEAIKARRDALAQELAERWPKITDEIVALLTRLEASDRECATVSSSNRLISAEAIARDCPPNFYEFMTPLHRFYGVRLPSLLGKGAHEFAWPAFSPNGPKFAVPTP